MENLVHRVTQDHLDCLVTRVLLVNKEKLVCLDQRVQEDIEDQLDLLETLVNLDHLDLEDPREKLETLVHLVNRVTLENQENVAQGYVNDFLFLFSIRYILLCFRVLLENQVTLELKVCLVWKEDLVHLDLQDPQVHQVTLFLWLLLLSLEVKQHLVYQEHLDQWDHQDHPVREVPTV